jgi:hypothetical protein
MKMRQPGFSGPSGTGTGWLRQPASSHRARPDGAKIPRLQGQRGRAMARLNPDSTCRDALFVSDIQPSDTLTADALTKAIRRAVRQFGALGCASRMAQEFGDHPDTAVERMRWIRQLAA